MRAWDQRRCVLLFMDGTRAMHHQAVSVSSTDSVYMRPMPVIGRLLTRRWFLTLICLHFRGRFLTGGEKKV